MTSPQPSPQGEGVEGLTTSYTYDIQNRLLSVKNGTKNIADYTYNSLTKTSQTLGNGITTNYTYDELLRLASLGNYDYTYNSQGNITSDGTDKYTYDSLGRLTGVNYSEVNIPEYNGDKIERFFYDNLGNRTNQENYTLKDVSTETCTDETVVENVTLPNGKTKTVERKVTKCETAVTQTEKQKNTITYDTNSLNQYIKLQNLNKSGEVKKEFTYKYDNNGNLIKDDINGYFYDYKNRLIKVIQNEVIKVDENGNIIETIPEQEIVNFTYDILGRRIEKKTQDKTINYIYAGQNAIKEIITNNTTNQIIETRENTYSNELDDILSTTITDYTTETPTTKTYFYEKNHLGSITKITDTTGAIIEQYEYDAFGVAYASINNIEAVTEAQSNKTLNIKKAEGSESDNGESDELVIDNIRYKRYNGIGKIGNTRLYTGREYDAELKLYYNRARYYSPDLGRFINRDPIDVADDVNLYAYVENNGVMFVDKMGLSKEFIDAHDATDIIVGLFNSGGKYYNSLDSKWEVIKAIGDLTVSSPNYQLKFNQELLDISIKNDEGKATGYVYVGGVKFHLSQLGNALYGYVGQVGGLSYNTIVFGAGLINLEKEFRRSEGFLIDNPLINNYWNEKADQELYKGGYNLGKNTEVGKITKEDLLDYLFDAKIKADIIDQDAQYSNYGNIYDYFTIPNAF